MKYIELQKILNSSSHDHWLFDDQRGIYTYKNDLNLRIIRDEIDLESDRFSGEDWATKHPDSTAYRVTFEIYYGASFIEEHILVSVDGFRATLPLPKVGTNKISQENYNLAKILDSLGTLDEYITRAGLEVGTS